MSKVTFEGVWKCYNDYAAVPDLNLEIPDGEFLVLVGPSGCGKTTTLRMLAGLTTPTYGRILIDGDDVTLTPPGRRDIAMVFQSYALYPHLTVRRNMSFGPEIRKDPKAHVDRRVKEVADLVGLADLLDRRPAELSGGQRQRVALARALIREPRLFLLDEPLSNLDAGLRTHMRAEISALQKRLGVTTVYVTHDQVEAMTMGHRIAVFDKGRVLQVASPSQLYRNPANRAVGTFIGSPKMNILVADMARDGEFARVKCLDTTFSIQAAKFFGNSDLPAKVELGIRPDDLHWIKDAPSRCSEHVTGKVKSIETTGSETFVMADVGGADVNARFPSFANLSIGQRVDLVFDPDELHFFEPETGNTLRSVRPEAEEQ